MPPTDAPDSAPRLARFAWFTVAANLLVILWGAFVRASGSGAGCGNHWPLCNGEVVPPSPTLATVIEFTHRLTSGVALLLVVALVVGARRALPRGHRVRAAAWVCLGVMILEALIGAGLVRFELVADNASMARALTLGAHLLNTLVLLAALVLTALWAGGAPPLRWREAGRSRWLLGLGTVGLILVGMTGAIASLGDTLFPARTLAEGLAQDLDPTSHLLLRLRVLHPTFAVVAGVLVLWIGTAAARWRVEAGAAGRRVAGLVLVQWAVGLTALALLVPVPLQLTHLLVADLLWMAWVVLLARVLGAQSGSASRTSEATARAASMSNTVPADSSR
ncbi:MAG: COX15/CtaA family protein [Gemmatimonadetes bacterium]|nr:COX15/CtaA family protein [Gemmatimonadota bacterium]